MALYRKTVDKTNCPCLLVILCLLIFPNYLSCCKYPSMPGINRETFLLTSSLASILSDSGVVTLVLQLQGWMISGELL